MKATVEMLGDVRTLKLEDPAKFRAQLKLLAEHATVVVKVENYDERKEKESLRSIAQNRYYHKMLDILCDHTGDDHMDMHEQLKIRFLSRPYVLDDKEYTIVKSTTDLTTKNFSEYLEKIFHWAASDLQVSLPTASDFY